MVACSSLSYYPPNSPPLSSAIVNKEVQVAASPDGYPASNCQGLVSGQAGSFHCDDGNPEHQLVLGREACEM
jgi:hypothetical protein